MLRKSRDRSKYILALYCANKQKIIKDNCNMECQSGRCLCMDYEQLLLLQCLAETKIVMNIGLNGRLEKKENISAVNYCSKQKDSFDRKLINCHGRNKIEGEYQQSERNVIGCLPVIQYVNMSDTVDVRRTVACLCLFHAQGSEVLKEYMKAVVKCLCRVWHNKKEVKEVCGAIERLFSDIIDLFQENNFQCAVKKISESAGQFADVYMKHAEHRFLYVIKDSDDYLLKKAEDYRNFSDAMECVLSDNTEIRGGLCHLYLIVQKILNKASCQMGTSTEGFFKKYQQGNLKHEVYEKVERFVDNLLLTKSHEEEQNIYCEIVKELDSEL